MVKAKVFVYKNHFVGYPLASDFELNDEVLPPIKNGEFLAEAVYISIDPYARVVANLLPTGVVFPGYQVAKIRESKNPQYPVGNHILGFFGWRTHTISDGKSLDGFPAPYLLPDFEGLPLSLALGNLGPSGVAAYFGFLEICQPKSGETVVITVAAGSVGNVVGQLGKMLGCRVIGIAGSEEKGKWLVDDLGFDHFINYNTEDIDNVLTNVAPDGVDCYFDNVGGEMSSVIMNHMRRAGRICVCGSISTYNDKSIKATAVQCTIIFKELTVKGFLSCSFADRWIEAILELLKWTKEGKLKHKESVTYGFENMFNAFIGMLNGSNIGKAFVKI